MRADPGGVLLFSYEGAAREGAAAWELLSIRAEQLTALIYLGSSGG